MHRVATTHKSQQNAGYTLQELRKARRYPLSASVHFSWLDSDGKLQQSEGVSRDLGMRGIFVLATGAPSVGTYVELDAYLPATHPGKAQRLHAKGKVLRVEQQGRVTKGFAAEVLFQPEPREAVLAPAAVQ